MPNFTPGPWFTECQGVISTNAYSILTERGWEGDAPWIAQVQGQNVGPKSAEETVANARLMAAAPELYEALKAISDCWGMGGSEDQFVRRMFEGNFVEAARSALAKAEGVNCHA